MFETTAAYIAGFIDGEGTISVKTGHPGRGSRDYVLRLRIVQTEGEVLLWIQKMCECGTIYTRNKIDPNYKQAYELSFNGKDALKVIKATIPFLKVKKQQAEAALKFEGTMVGRGKILSKDQIEERERLRTIINARSKGSWRAI